MSNEKPTQNQVAKREPQRAVARRMESNPMLLTEADWTRLTDLSKAAVRSGLLPKAIDSEQKAFVIGLKGLSLDIDPLTAWEEIAVVNGKTTISGKLMLRLIYERCPGATVDFVTEVGKENTECALMMARPGKTARRFSFTLEDAKRAGLLNKPGPWTQYPRTMLRWRAVAEGARVMFSDVIQGVYIHEEMGANVDEQGEIIEVEVSPSPESPVTAKPPAIEIKIPAPEAARVAAIETANRLGFHTPESHESAVKLLWKTARASGWGEEHVRQHIQAKHKKESTKELGQTELHNCLKFFELHPVTAPTEGRFTEEEVDISEAGAVESTDKPQTAKPEATIAPASSESLEATRSIYAQANKTGWSPEDVQNYVNFELGVQSVKDLTPDQASGLCIYMDMNRKKAKE